MSTTMFDLRGLVAVVSGGGGWLGAAMVAALADAGALVVSVGRDLRTLEDAAAASGLTSEQVVARSCDVTTEAWPELLADTCARHGRIDVLVNAAHVSSGGSLKTAQPDDYLRATNQSVIAASEGIRAAMPGFEASVAAGGSPSVVNVASMYGLVSPDPRLYASEGDRNPPHYGAAKAALLQLTRYAAAELGPAGVRVNAISPGPFPTAAVQRDAEFVARLASRTMLGRVGAPEDLKTAVLFLASPHSRFVTGSNVVADGGWTAW